MSNEAKRKVAAWRAVAGDADTVKLHESISLSVPPSSIRATFPGLTPFRTLRSEDILAHIVRLPSVHVTAYASLLFGAVITFTLVGSRLQNPPSPARLSCGALLMIGFIRLIHSRLPSVKLVPNSMDVSSSPRGPCRVVNDVLSITNSHAGTHADMPTHFCHSADAAPFDDDHYTGDAFIVDISHLLRGDKMTPKPITTHIVETVLSYLPVESNVWRLLFVSRRGSGHSDDVWEGGFAYFEPEAVRLLAEKCPSLLLVGTDAPSVDHPEVAPICEAAHGELYKNGIAILENLQFTNAYPLLENMPCAPDSRNCGLLWLQREAKEAEAAAACGSIAAAAGAAAQAIAFDAALGRARIERRGGMGAALRGIERIRRLIAAEAETAAEGELRAAARSAALRHRLVQLQETMCTPCGVSRSRWGREKEEKEEDEEEEEEVTLYRALAVLREYAISDPRNIHETHNSDGSQVDRVDRATFDVVKRRLLFELRHAETETAELEKSVARLRETHESLSRHRKDEHEKLSALHLEKMVLKNRIAVYENTR